MKRHKDLCEYERKGSKVRESDYHDTMTSNPSRHLGPENEYIFIEYVFIID
ncbi:hypothetical protein ACTXT7_012016 [Hymenolepis weldensis]